MVGPFDCAGPVTARALWLPVPLAETLQEFEPMGTSSTQGTPRCLVPRVPPGAQVPNGSQRTVNGPLTDPLTANGRIRPLTVNGWRNLGITTTTASGHFSVRGSTGRD